MSLWLALTITISKELQAEHRCGVYIKSMVGQIETTLLVTAS
jgi:hypothetical protein